MLNEIREKAGWVVANADHVRVHADKIPGYAASLLAHYPVKTAGMNTDWHLVDAARPDLTAMYVLALDSINFGSGYFKALTCRPGLSDYATIAQSLKDAFVPERLYDAKRLSEITAADCARIFGQQDAEILELMELFARALNKTGHIILNGYQGSVLKLLDAANGSAEALVAIVAQWPDFKDVVSYKGKAVPLLKRAQILAADLNMALPGLFSDIKNLTIFADNMVPHVLRTDGILSYDTGLARCIDAGEMIAAGSPEETEIRAAAIHAVELMVKASSGRTAFDFDQILWHRGYEPGFSTLLPHRTRTIFY